MNNESDGGGGPLSGLRIIDATVTIGAYATRLFADLGADVIRVERPGLDGGGMDTYGRFANSGKRSVVLDIDRADGRALFDRLLQSADMLVESFNPEWADARSLGPADLRARHPRLIHVSITAYGRDRTDARSDVDLVLLAAGGLLHLGGYPDAEPMMAYGRQSDVAASLFGAVGALVALLDRERTGRGCWVDVSAQECVAQGVEDSVATYELTGVVRQRLGSEPREAGSGIFPCADGYVAMVAGRLGTAKAWDRLVQWMIEDGVEGSDQLAEPEWSTLQYRQRPESIRRFASLFATFAGRRTRLELYRDAQRRGIALSPVNDIAAVLKDPQLREREFFVTVNDPTLGRALTYPGPPYRLSATPAMAARPAPRPGAHIADVLRELSASEPEFASLREPGATV